MDASCYEAAYEINRNLKLVGYEISKIGGVFKCRTSLVGVLMLYSDYCNSLNNSELDALTQNQKEWYSRLLPLRGNYITDHIYPVVIRIESPLVTEYDFISFDFEEFVWSDFGI